MSVERQLPESWQTYRFDQMAQNINERVLPADAEGLPYVGLEHLDSESLKIYRWGTPDEVEAQKLRFYPGDIIFGKRRFYQRKLAVADVEGICSAHAMVLRAKEDVVDPLFLPFFMQSEMFYERAMSISVGSLSPTINWSALAQQEFPLPPLDEQHRIAEILWAVEEAIESAEMAIEQAQAYKVGLAIRYTLRGIETHRLQHTVIGELPRTWRLTTVGEVLEIAQYGLSESADREGKYPIFRMMNIIDGVIVENDMKFIDLTDEEFESYHVAPGDILFNRTNSMELVGKVGIYRLSGNHVFASYLIRLRAKTDLVLPEYLNYYLNSRYGQAQIRRYITPGVSQANINATNLRKVRFPLPPIDEQRSIIEAIRAVEENIERLRKHRSVLGTMKRRLITTMIEPSLEQTDVQ